MIPAPPSAPIRRASSGRHPQGRAPAPAGAHRRHDQRHGEHDDAERRAPAEHPDRLVADERRGDLPLDDRAVPDVRREHDDRRGQRCQRGREEAPVGLEQPGEDDAQPVERHLHGEDPQQGGGHLGRARVAGDHDPRRDRLRQQPEQARERHEHQQGPAEQHGCRVVGPVALPGPEPLGDDRHGDRGEDATGRDLEEHVGDGVDALVDAADATGAHGIREDEDAREARDPGEQRRDGDQPGGPRDPGGETSAGHRAGRPQASSSRSPGVDSMTRVNDTFSEARVSAARAARATSRPAATGAREERGAEQRTGGVGAGVAEHRGTGEVGAQHAEGGARRGGGLRGTGPRRRQQEGGRGDHRRLQGPARAQVEQVGQVRGTGDDGPADEGVEAADVVAAPVGQRRGDQPGRPDADDLDQPGRHLAAGGGTEVAPQALAGAVTGQVVEGAEGPRAERCHDPGRPGRGGTQRRAGHVGRALEERDRVTRRGWCVASAASRPGR